eukprot:125273-Chlamydomonas_euryale.AAC.1
MDEAKGKHADALIQRLGLKPQKIQMLADGIRAIAKQVGGGRRSAGSHCFTMPFHTLLVLAAPHFPCPAVPDFPDFQCPSRSRFSMPWPFPDLLYRQQIFYALAVPHLPCPDRPKLSMPFPFHTVCALAVPHFRSSQHIRGTLAGRIERENAQGATQQAKNRRRCGFEKGRQQEIRGT